MNRKQLIQFIKEEYGKEEEYLWAKYPNYAVFRHSVNRKWFAVVMDVPKNKLGLAGDEIIDLLVVKCSNLLIGSLIQKRGFYPAYHMNKTNWISIALDGSVDDEEIKMLINMSYELTGERKKPSVSNR